MNDRYVRLTPQDIGVMRKMLRMFGEVFEEPATYQGAAPSDDYLRSLLAQPHFFAIAALAGDEVIGGLAAYELRKYERERSEIYIYDLAVLSDHRRRGVATNLIGELKRIAQTGDAWVIFVQADPGDDPAIALYTKLGVREDVHHFDIRVR